MEDQKLLDLENDVLPAQELKTVPLITDDGLLCEDVQNDYSNDIDDLILQPEKVIKLEKQPSLEHSYEVIDQEPHKAFNVDEDNTEVAGKSTNKENDIILESDIINSVNIDDLDIIPLKTEYPKEDLLINLEKPLKKSESPLLSQVTDHDKTEKNQENEPPNVVQPNVKIEDIPEVISTVSTKKDSDEDISDIKIGPEELFCRIGLDKWFYPEKLPPKVEALVYWRNPVLSGAVFGITLVVLLSFAYMSLISVVAYLAIFVQSACILLRLYKTALQTVQKTSESHPFQEYLDLDIRLPQEKAEELSKLAVVHINAVLVELRRLLLAEDLVDSAKFFGILWVLTYVGALFNGLTLIIIGFIALFTLPKVYENNKTQIDQNIELVRSKIAELTNKVRAAIPIGKKTPETKKKE